MTFSLFQGFPDFNLYSTPLLILVVQALLLAALLLGKFTNLEKDAKGHGRQ